MSDWSVSPSKVYESARKGVVIPCKDCKRRDKNCHSACEEYGAYKQKLKDLHDEIYNKYKPDSITAQCKVKQIRKARKHKERYKWG